MAGPSSIDEGFSSLELYQRTACLRWLVAYIWWNMPCIDSTTLPRNPGPLTWRRVLRASDLGAGCAQRYQGVTSRTSQDIEPCLYTWICVPAYTHAHTCTHIFTIYIYFCNYLYIENHEFTLVCHILVQCLFLATVRNLAPVLYHTCTSFWSPFMSSISWPRWAFPPPKPAKCLFFFPAMASRVFKLDVGSQFPDQGLNLGCSGETTKS